ncbi:MAG: hypothetical protein Q8K26_03450, partial [Candidatus Gracilibacteria bacterium]|nr:hypothetical protein [Candidatus Gracilibacteria bacterium]
MFRCRECGNTSQKWQGKCLACEGWNTFDEEVGASSPKSKKGNTGKERQIFSILPTKEALSRIRLSSEELNTVLGDGLTPGSLILLSGEPGIGKSTLALQITDWYAGEVPEKCDIQAQNSVSSFAVPKQSTTHSGTHSSLESHHFGETSKDSIRTAIYVSAEENIH